MCASCVHVLVCTCKRVCVRECVYKLCACISVHMYESVCERVCVQAVCMY